MRIRPRLLEGLHESLAIAIRREITRRGITMREACLIAGWQSNSHRERVSLYIRGDTRALGHEAALKLAEALGIRLRYDIVAPKSGSIALTRVAA